MPDVRDTREFFEQQRDLCLATGLPKPLLMAILDAPAMKVRWWYAAVIAFMSWRQQMAANLLVKHPTADHQDRCRVADGRLLSRMDDLEHQFGPQAGYPNSFGAVERLIRDMGMGHRPPLMDKLALQGLLQGVHAGFRHQAGGGVRGIPVQEREPDSRVGREFYRQQEARCFATGLSESLVMKMLDETGLKVTWWYDAVLAFLVWREQMAANILVDSPAQSLEERCRIADGLLLDRLTELEDHFGPAAEAPNAAYAIGRLRVDLQIGYIPPRMRDERLQEFLEGVLEAFRIADEREGDIWMP